MKRLLVLALGLSLSTAVVAAEAPALRTGALVKSADGGRVGFIYRINTDTTGEPVSITLIYNSHFIKLDVTTLAPAEKGWTTSLTKAQVNKL